MIFNENPDQTTIVNELYQKSTIDEKRKSATILQIQHSVYPEKIRGDVLNPKSRRSSLDTQIDVNSEISNKLIK